ncbi:hypothetical protein FB567DRAFT_74020 [Paraphoma chrysanthemicola]|uniref:Geranylgeranyl pyrophosphate synthetase n=1 Tax=Paraphoma chrysanthemicola TaxID=798071 RepID=A0A8K0R3X9_9PLEO|nr:hypothetical protein FB567DRAFT_74020 [Paraphoma chrysanthemicola]
MFAVPTARGGYAPRRGRGGWTKKSFAKPKREYVKPDTKAFPLGDLLKAFDLFDPTESTPKTTKPPISNVQYIASYNWVNDDTCTILVPGKPPQWTPPREAQRLKEDSGQYYRDPNAANYPKFPIAPVVQAVLSNRPGFPTDSVDVLACGSTMGNLLRFVRGQDKPFRFAVETIGNTVFFIRKENYPKEIIPDVRGFGHSFPEAYTTWEKEVKGSDTHQRIVQYEFGGLTCLVRFECDGYIKENPSPDKSTAHRSARSDGPKSDGADLLKAFGQATVTQPSFVPVLSGKTVSIKRGGDEIAQACIFDLKTRSGKYKTDIDMSDIYPQLWVKQIPNFIVAYHDGAGLFQKVEVKDVRDDVVQWEKDNLDAIGRLNALLGKIISFARQDGGLLEVYFPGSGQLEIRRQHGNGQPALPDDLRDSWADIAHEDSYFSDSDGGGYTLGGHGDSGEHLWGADSDEEEPDYTACSAEDCGYCGKCTY